MEKVEILDQLVSIEKKRKLNKKEKLALQAAILKYKKATTWKQVMEVLALVAKLLI